MKRKNNYLLIHYSLLNRLSSKIKKISRMMKKVKSGPMMISMSLKNKKNLKKRKMINITKIRNFLQKEENLESKEISLMSKIFSEMIQLMLFQKMILVYLKNKKKQMMTYPQDTHQWIVKIWQKPEH